MIGQPEWFKRRKYGGWGLFPATWQGWLYIVLAVIPFFLINYISNTNVRIASYGLWALVFIIDMIDIMSRIKHDERERIHEAIAERNALWAVIAVLATGVGYQAATSAASQNFAVDPVILIALAAAVIVKAVSNIYLDRND